MKTPNRNFVVEFKGRRQPKAQSTSIWGDTDFKALVREVEDQTPHLFKANGVGYRPHAAGDIRPEPESQAHANKSEVNAALTLTPRPVIAVPRPEPSTSPAADTVDLESPERVPEKEPVTVSVNSLTQLSQKRASRLPGAGAARAEAAKNKAQSNRPAYAADQAVLDEIEALDAENRRLKKLLAQQLIFENFQLRKMLERFGVV